MGSMGSTHEEIEADEPVSDQVELSLWTGQTSGSNSGRIHSYDIARAIAFIGMAMVNLRASWPEEAKELGEGTERLLELLQGRSATTFVVLAGIGLTLSRARHEQARARGELKLDLESHITRRAVVLMAVGLTFSVFWTLDILHFYAVYLILSLFFLRARWTTLAIASLCFMMGSWFAPWQLGLTDDFTPDGIANIGQYYIPIGTLLHLVCIGPYPVFPWMAFILYGLWFGREPIHVRRADWRVWFLGGVMWLGGEAISLKLLGLLTPKKREVWESVLDTSPFPGFGLFALSNLGSATLIILLCSLLSSQLERWGKFKLLSDMGQMMLSLYILHAFLIDLGLALTAKLMWSPERRLWTIYMVIIAISAAVAYLWRRRFKYGPLEMLMNYFVGYTSHTRA